MIVNEADKLKIYNHIQKNIGWYSHEYAEKIAEFTSKGILDKEFATSVLENLVYSCGLTKSELKVTKEFENDLLEADNLFNIIPKSKEYEKNIYARQTDVDIYKGMDIKEIYSNLNICLNIEEVYNKVLFTQNLRNRADLAIHSIKSMSNKKINISEENKEIFSQICDNMKELLSRESTNEIAIQDEINKYNKEASRIWNEYLGNEEGILVHNLSKGDYEGEFNKKYMSASLITDKTMGLFNESRGNCFGFIIKPKHIISATGKDSFTNNSPVINECMEKFANGNIPPIKLPWEVEQECIKRTVEQNGEMLNYDTRTIYSEIVLDDYEIESMYYRSNGEGELAPNYEIAKKMSEERGLELREIDITKARENLGLEPMTEKMQKNFFKNILRNEFFSKQDIKNSEGNDLIEKENQLTESHYKEFYERYLELRKNGEYTKDDILQAFDVTVPNNAMREINEQYNQEENIMAQKQQNSNESLNIIQKLVKRVSSNQFLNKLRMNKLKKLPQSKIESLVKKEEPFISEKLKSNGSFIENLQKQSYTTEEIVKSDIEEKNTIKTPIMKPSKEQDKDFVI